MSSVDEEKPRAENFGGILKSIPVFQFIVPNLVRIIKIGESYHIVSFPVSSNKLLLDNKY